MCVCVDIYDYKYRFPCFTYICFKEKIVASCTHTSNQTQHPRDIAGVAMHNIDHVGAVNIPTAECITL